MFDSIVKFSIRNRLFVALFTLLLLGAGIYSMVTLLIIPIFYRLAQTTGVMLRNSHLSNSRFKSKKSIATLLLLLMLPTWGVAQTVTLQQAIEQALTFDPRLKKTTATIARNKAARGESWELSPTTVTYSRGKLNGIEFNDNQLSIEQSFGSLLTPFYKNALVKSQVRNATHYQAMVAREVTAEVKRAWYTYLYANSLTTLYNQQYELAKKLKEIGALRYQAGDITLLEQKVSLSTSLTMQNLLMQATREKRVATERLQWVCYTEMPLQPTDPFTPPAAMEEGVMGTSELYLSYYQGLVEEQQAAKQVEKSRLFPELFAGYQRQSILPDKGLASWSVGISLPIFFMPQRSRIRQAKFATQEAQYQSEAAIRTINLQLIELRTQLMQCMENLAVYHNSLLPEAKELRRATEVQLRNGELDITQAVQAINASLEIEKSYLELLLQSHITTIEYELYN